jgi:hypothetical protein
MGVLPFSVIPGLVLAHHPGMTVFFVFGFCHANVLDNASKGIRFCKQPIHFRASAIVSRFR